MNRSGFTLRPPDLGVSYLAGLTSPGRARRVDVTLEPRREANDLPDRLALEHCCELLSAGLGGRGPRDGTEARFRASAAVLRQRQRDGAGLGGARLQPSESVGL